MRRVSIVTLAGLALAAVALAGIPAVAQAPGGSADAKKLKNPVPVTAGSLKTGEALFQKNCRFCHGADAKGNGPQAPKDTHPPNLTDETWDHGSTDGEIFTVIQNGAGPKLEMKGYKGRISDQDIWNVINYLRSLGPQAKR